MASFGEGLGGIIGGVMAKDDLSDASNTIAGNTAQVMGQTQPYVNFGTGLLDTTSNALKGNTTVGAARLGGGGNDVQSYQDFMKTYQTSDAAKYQIGQATDQIDNSSAARGKLLSGANLRSINETTQSIANTYANTAYNEYLQGNQQQFGQLQSIIGNLFQGIGVGQTATGQNVSAVSSQNSAQAALAQAEAKADQGIGSGIGSMFGGMMSLAKK
jgi:hypothetical protein